MPSTILRVPAFALAMLLGFLGAPAAQAAPGDLDATFGTGGRAQLVVEGYALHAGGAQLQGDGKILVSGTAVSADGTARWLIARFHADGKLDTSFGTAGYTLLRPQALASFSRAESIALLSGGAIRLGGQVCGQIAACLSSGGTSAEVTVVGLTSQGTIDAQFGDAGYYTETGSNGRSPVWLGALPQQLPGSASITESTLILYEAYGCCARSPSQLVLRKLSESGAPDGSFPATRPLPFAGAAQVSAPTSLLTQSDGTLLIGSYPYGRVARLRADGELDARFGQLGWVALGSSPYDGIQSLVATPDGGLLALRTDTSNAGAVSLIKLSPDGAFDPQFGVGGVRHFDTQGRQLLAAQLDDAGRVILLARQSSSDPALVLTRLTDGFEPDHRFGTAGQVPVGFAAGYYGPMIYQRDATGLLRQRDGKLLVFGTSAAGLALARFDTAAESAGAPGTSAGGCGQTRNAALDPTLLALLGLAAGAMALRPRPRRA